MKLRRKRDKECGCIGMGYPMRKCDKHGYPYLEAAYQDNRDRSAQTGTYRTRGGPLCTAHAWGLRVALPDTDCEQCKSDMS